MTDHGKKYEYRVVSMESNDPENLTASLNREGGECWEVIQIVPQAGSTQLVYLKREKDRR